MRDRGAEKIAVKANAETRALTNIRSLRLVEDLGWDDTLRVSSALKAESQAARKLRAEFWSGRADLNCRPLAPQASALPG
jgi:hypothetical protein